MEIIVFLSIVIAVVAVLPVVPATKKANVFLMMW